MSVQKCAFSFVENSLKPGQSLKHQCKFWFSAIYMKDEMVHVIYSSGNKYGISPDAGPFTQLTHWPPETWMPF